MTTGATATKVHEVEDAWEFLEMAYKEGWTDGLPVAPPTPDRVRAMIDYVKKDPNELLGVIPPMGGKATVEKVAIQAVMAGCKPEYFPVVLAALECILTEDDKWHFNIKGVQDTTNPVTPLVIVSGPIVEQLGFHYRENAFGGHSRANASIGRAIRLILWNLGGARPGETDMTHLGHPGKYSYCVAENPNADDNPWTRFNVEWGYAPDQSTVTVFGCEAPRSILTPQVLYADADGTLKLLAISMATPGSNNAHMVGQVLVTINPLTAHFLQSKGYTKEAVRRYFWEHARNKLRDLEELGLFNPTTGSVKFRDYLPWMDQSDLETMVPIVEREENIHIIVTGADRLPWNSICHGWGNFGAYAVTKPVKLPS